MAGKAHSRKRDSFAHLDREYTFSQRIFWILFLVAFALFSSFFFSHIILGFTMGSLLGLTLMFLLALLVADFLSGLLHWAADTWGNVDWPFVGKSIIQPFRLHHVDQKGITRHSFLETNGNVAFAVVLVQTLGYLFLTFVYSSYLLMSFLAFLTFIGFFTNQIHKLAHQDHVPRVIAFLQKKGFILSPEHHKMHHTAPYTKHYCITFGWMNSFLQWIGFFPFLEKIIVFSTGLQPRSDVFLEGKKTKRSLLSKT